MEKQEIQNGQYNLEKNKTDAGHCLISRLTMKLLWLHGNEKTDAQHRGMVEDDKGDKTVFSVNGAGTIGCRYAKKKKKRRKRKEIQTQVLHFLQKLTQNALWTM